MIKIPSVIDRAIWYTFLALAIITPLIFLTTSTELFELPKMIVVYFGAAILLTLTLIKFVLSQKILLPQNWIFYSLFACLIIQIFSTIFSIDKFTSVFGYPSRLNGGLTSQISYLIIFVGAYVNLDLKRARDLLSTTILSAFVVSLWGIAGHFGKDPSCVALIGKLTSSCWQKDFNPELRIFSTLGQPNWLASYLVLVLPASTALFLTLKNYLGRLLMLAASLTMFTALVMTNSRAGLLGAALSFSLLIMFLLVYKTNRQWALKPESLLKATVLLVGFLTVLGLFGKYLFTRLNEAIETKPSAQNVIQNTQAASSPTESGQIRLIVWQGAIKAFAARPILGWGPETFAYSYYLYRPPAHNQTTESNFFYNKAHNEFLNYLVNTGILTTAAYVAFLTLVLFKLFEISQKTKQVESLLLAANAAAICGYLVTIFLGFSTVTTNLIFFLLVAISLTFDPKRRLLEIKLPTAFSKNQNLIIAMSSIGGLLLASIPSRIYSADFLANKAGSYDTTEIRREYETMVLATNVFPGKNPFYLAELSYTAALYATSSYDPQSVKSFTNSAVEYAKQTETLAPANIQVLRKAANAYFLISDLQKDENLKNEYTAKALTLGEKLTKLAPTDPNSYLTFAKIQAGLGLENEAVVTLKKALELKPDFVQAQELLEQLTP